MAIVGGGITGALAAHAFASAGIPNVLLEASTVGRGSTAASSALLLEEPDLELGQLVERYGLRTSRRIWELSQESTRELVALLKRLRIRRDLERSDAVYYAVDERAVDRLRRELEVRRRCGFAAEWLGPGELQRLTGISALGAIRSRAGARMDPSRVRGSGARRRRRRSADLRALRGDTHRPGLRPRTREDAPRVARGRARDRRYRLRHAPFRPLAGRFRMYRTYVLATERLGPARRRDLGLSDVMVWDTERPYHYARWTADHRLLLGGGDRLVRPGQRRRQQFTTATSELRAYFETRFPALADLQAEHAWEGLFAMTPDSLPYIGPHRRYPLHWFALGYGGNGMTFAYLAARLLLERWQGRTSSDHALFEFGRSR